MPVPESDVLTSATPGIHAVHDEVHYHLLHMDRVGTHRQRLGCKDNAQRDFALHHLGRHDLDQFGNGLIQIECLQFGLFSVVQQIPKTMISPAR